MVSVLDVETRILGVINCVGIGISRQRRQGPDDGEKAPGQESLPEAKQPYTSTPALDNIWAIAPVSPEARVRCQSRRVVSARATIANDRSYSRASSKAGSTTYSDLQRPQQRAPPALAPCVRCRPGQFQAGTLEGGFVAVGGGQGRGSPDGGGGARGGLRTGAVYCRAAALVAVVCRVLQPPADTQTQVRLPIAPLDEVHDRGSGAGQVRRLGRSCRGMRAFGIDGAAVADAARTRGRGGPSEAAASASAKPCDSVGMKCP